MKNEQIAAALLRLVPEAKWSLSGDNFNDVIWLCECEKPTFEEVETEIAKEPEIQNAKKEAKKMILEKLGLTADDVTAVLS
jgi:hypothetical protein